MLDEDGNTILMKLAQKSYLGNHREIIDLLVEHPKIDLNHQNTLNNDTILHIAVSRCHIGILESIHTEVYVKKTKDIDINIQNKNYETPLFTLMSYGSRPTLSSFLEFSYIDVNLADKSLFTPIMIGIKQVRIYAVKELILKRYEEIDFECTAQINGNDELITIETLINEMISNSSLDKSNTLKNKEEMINLLNEYGGFDFDFNIIKKNNQNKGLCSLQ
eukprot:TRINITY_DN15149_c0_g1_i1.p1 TRINITY_DN15149_c0_g1~~TRINITY_DN15149_c0_g1_i1.p1  ORF type:complete len:219 (-),score=26.58 TRINITY_DN15149_c0_g1_i1:4-660(-)